MIGLDLWWPLICRRNGSSGSQQQACWGACRMLRRRKAIVGRFAAYLRPRSFRGARAVIAKNAGHRAKTTAIHPLALRSASAACVQAAWRAMPKMVRASWPARIDGVCCVLLGCRNLSQPIYQYRSRTALSDCRDAALPALTPRLLAEVALSPHRCEASQRPPPPGIIRRQRRRSPCCPRQVGVRLTLRWRRSTPSRTPADAVRFGP